MQGLIELLWHRERKKDLTKENVRENYGKIKEVKRVVLPFQKIELLGIKFTAEQIS